MRLSTKRAICGGCGKVLDKGQFCGDTCVRKVNNQALQDAAKGGRVTIFGEAITKENLIRLATRQAGPEGARLLLRLKKYPYEDLRPFLQSRQASQLSDLLAVWPGVAEEARVKAQRDAEKKEEEEKAIRAMGKAIPFSPNATRVIFHIFDEKDKLRAGFTYAPISLSGEEIRIARELAQKPAVVKKSPSYETLLNLKEIGALVRANTGRHPTSEAKEKARKFLGWLNEAAEHYDFTTTQLSLVKDYGTALATLMLV